MKRNSFNLVICLVCNFYPENPQQGVVFVSFIIYDSCYADLCSNSSKTLLGHFIQLFSTVKIILIL